ncbi:MAG TPA: transcriptional regulator, partial [Balneola sp.]|nr:transcriptional regulator [Balneola sp.]
SPEFAENFEEGYLNFKIGVILRQARENMGATQADVAEKLNTTKSVISRMENHAEDIK